MIIENVDGTPSPALLLAIRAEKQKWNLLIAEALDNSFGAGASRATITMDKDAVTITDNGWGIRFGNEEGLYKLGKHLGQMTSKGIGLFGVGIKWQANNAGDRLEFSSVSVDNEVFGSVDFAEMIRSDSWKRGITIDRRPVEVGKPTGTTIIISRLRVKPATNAEILKAREEVARRYRPALAMGHSVAINGIEATLPPDPEMTDIITATIELGGGKGATLVGGLLKHPDTADLTGVHVAKGYKIILDSTKSFGVGEYTGAAPRIYCFVDLIGPWEIDRFKEEISDVDADALDRAIEQHLLPILEKAESASIDARTDEFVNEVNSLVPLPIAAGARPKKNPEHKPADQPTAKREKRAQNNATKNPTDDDDGPAKAVRNNRLLRIEFAPTFAKVHGIGQYIRSAGRSPHVVRFARDCPAIHDYIRRPRNSGAKPLVDLALGWFIFAQSTLFADDYGTRMWDLMQHQVAVATPLPSAVA